MNKYTLKVEDGRVAYLMKAGKDMVRSDTTEETATWMCQNGKVSQSDAHPGYPICVNGEYFIAGSFANDPETAPAEGPRASATTEEKRPGTASEEPAKDEFVIRRRPRRAEGR